MELVLTQCIAGPPSLTSKTALPFSRPEALNMSHWLKLARYTGRSRRTPSPHTRIYKCSYAHTCVSSSTCFPIIVDIVHQRSIILFLGIFDGAELRACTHTLMLTPHRYRYIALTSYASLLVST